MTELEKKYKKETGNVIAVSVSGHPYVEWLENKLEQRLEAGQHETIVMCADCGAEIDRFKCGVVKAELLDYGVYYEGDPICNKCLEVKRENHIAECEAKEAT